jgi:hypothetical protein
MEAKLSFIGHALMENRNGLFVAARLTKVSGHAERLAALDMIEPYADRPTPITLGGDKGFDAADFIMELREINGKRCYAALWAWWALAQFQGSKSSRRLTGWPDTRRSKTSVR